MTRLVSQGSCRSRYFSGHSSFLLLLELHFIVDKAMFALITETVSTDHKSGFEKNKDAGRFRLCKCSDHLCRRIFSRHSRVTAKKVNRN